jgi:uncharacterized membrane protein YphA (DoxX/SURF4 family)
MEKFSPIVYYCVRLIAALIMLQTLFFKFSASAESVYIFTTVGMEPWGRIAVGVLELAASILLLIGSTAWVGASLAAGLMGGAIAMHLTKLGISVQDDGGYLFILAVIVLLCSLYVLFKNQNQLLAVAKLLYPASRK